MSYRQRCLEDMPGPIEEAKPLQLEQRRTLHAFYQAWGEAEKAGQVDVNHFPTSLELDGAWEHYKETVFRLLDLLGEQAHCAYVDTMLWSDFSDAFKEVVTCRPTGLHYDRVQVLEWLKAHNMLSRFIA